MDEDKKDNLDASNQDGDTSTDTDDNGTSDDSGDDKYENQKKRAEKAEAEAKAEKEKRAELEQKVQALTQKDEPKPDPKKSDSPLSREEAILYAQGKSEALVEKAKKIAEVEGISLTEATATDIFKTYEEQAEKEQADKAAQLGASSGSAPHKNETFHSGMKKEDHKALWAKATENLK